MISMCRVFGRCLRREASAVAPCTMCNLGTLGATLPVIEIFHLASQSQLQEKRLVFYHH